MEETKFTVTVECKVPLTAADLRFLQADINSRLYATLMQKIVDIKFSVGTNGNH